jgi:pyruvate dehydrogenase E2 component (dihydrolipoamide acetyltransferase)
MKDFTLPSLGADMDEGMLAAWLVAPGDTITRGQVIAEVETDKGIIEVECWEDAVVAELVVEPSEERLAVGTVIARLDAMTGAAGGAEEPQPDEHTSDGDEPNDGAPPLMRAAPAMSPPVRHLAHQLGVDDAALTGSGPDGVVTRDDVRHAAKRRAPVGSSADGHRIRATPMARRIASERRVEIATIQPRRRDGLVTSADVDAAAAGEPEAAEVRPQPAKADAGEAMRRAIARSMERSKREIPHYYLATPIDVAVAMSWLDTVNEDRPITRRILPAALLLKATALALADFPELNGHWVDGAFAASPRVNLGVAVSLRGGGLVAPAIHDASGLSLDDMMAALTDLVARARAGRLRGSEMSEQTCTVTNLGDRGVESTFPVIIPPQVAIIGFGRVADAPVVADGSVAVHPVVHASLAGDHRVTDGHTGGLFLLAIERRLQEPDAL